MIDEIRLRRLLLFKHRLFLISKLISKRKSGGTERGEESRRICLLELVVGGSENMDHLEH